MSKLVQKPWALVAFVVVIALALGACSQQIAQLQEPAAETQESPTAADAAQAGGEEVETDGNAATEEGATDVAGGDESEAAPLAVGEYNGLTVGLTAEGYPFRGSPDAPVTIYEYSDFQCPFCARYVTQTEPALDDAYVRDGTVRVVFREFPLEGLHPNARAAHVASLCVADQGPEIYWEMHDQIFRTQGEWSALGDAPTYFADLATEIGVDMEQFAACIESGEKNAVVDAGIQEAQMAGFGGTPSFLVVNEASGDAFELVGAQPYEQFVDYIESALAGDIPAAVQAQREQEQARNEIPFWATAEGLEPDPDNPGQTMAGDAWLGNPDASVTVIEFSDFQCPFCQRHTTQTKPILDEQFVETGDVYWVFKHFPLPIHPQAPAAGAAAECAGEQGKFWEMHHLLFEDINRWGNNDVDATLTEIAAEVGLDADAFAACMADGEALARVESDRNDGAPFVSGTPTFIVLTGEQGRILPGALPAEDFTNFLQETLDSVAN